MIVCVINCLLRILIYSFLLYLEIYVCSSLEFKVLPATGWHEAVSKCEDIGMQLATIKTQEMQTEIDRLFENRVIDSSDHLWIGLYWKANNQTFYWIDGEKMTFSNWDVSVNEPGSMQPFGIKQEDNLYENCVRIINGLWRTRECNFSFKVLCMGYNGSDVSSVEDDYKQTSLSPMERSVVSSRVESTTFMGDTVFTTTTLPRTRAIVLCPDQAVSICDCKIIKNISTTVNRNTEDHIYKIHKTKTSAYHRHHNCAHDERFSAKVIGLTGSAVLGGVLLCIICCDITRVANTSNRPNKRCLKPGL